MKFVKVSAFLVTLGLFLSGCTEIPSSEPEAQQEALNSESQVAEESTETVTEPIKTEPTTSELEACETIPEIVTLAKDMNGGDGPVEISEVTSEYTHLQAVGAVLIEEDSSMTASMEDFLEVFGSLYPILGTNAFGTLESLTNGLRGLDSQLSKLGRVCTDLGVLTDFQSLPKSPAAFYPDGFWFEVVTEDFLNYGLVSNDDIWERSLEEDEVFLETNNNKALSMTLTCDVTNGYFDVLVDRINGDFESDEFGPNGETEFSYSLDGGPALTADGYFLGGMLWPFALSSSDNSSGSKAWEAFSEAERTIEIEMDVPGARFTHVLNVTGMDRVGEELKSAGCFDL